ncbi:MAG: hypothetical protein ACJAXK_002992 [Yoonia sp.]|jgi:hypothetical protein
MIGVLINGGKSHASANNMTPNCIDRPPRILSALGANHIDDTKPVADPNNKIPKRASFAPSWALITGTEAAKHPQNSPTTTKAATGRRDTERALITDMTEVLDEFPVQSKFQSIGTEIFRALDAHK